jgi:hypothetical protein
MPGEKAGQQQCQARRRAAWMPVITIVTFLSYEKRHTILILRFYNLGEVSSLVAQLCAQREDVVDVRNQWTWWEWRRSRCVQV